MNNYHRDHPDPEIRAKYASWKESYAGYLARSRGFTSPKEMEDAKKEKTAMQRNLPVLLSTIRQPARAKSKAKLHRSANRGA